MIDLHCHFLPGIDDGAQTLEDGLALARAAAADGITHSVLTPHVHPGRYENTRSSIERSFDVFRAALAAAGIPLEVDMAAEVRLCPEILPLLEDGEIPFLGELDGYRIMLLEFPHSHIPPGADKLVAHLLKRNIRPLIAHPERNKDVMRDLARILPFVEMGCYLQITASAVAGHFGDVAQIRAYELLELDVFTVLASDAHNLKGRQPGLSEGVNAAAAMLGMDAARDLVLTNPFAIVGSAAAAMAHA